MPLNADDYGDDREFRKGVPGKFIREFFMTNGSYLFCEVLENDLGDRNIPDHKRRMKCRTPSGREFVAKMMYGTWGEVRSWDLEP